MNELEKVLDLSIGLETPDAKKVAQVLVHSFFVYPQGFTLSDEVWARVFVNSVKAAHWEIIEWILQDARVRSLLPRHALTLTAAHIESLIVHKSSKFYDFLVLLSSKELWPITKDLFNFVDWPRLMVLSVSPNH